MRVFLLLKITVFCLFFSTLFVAGCNSGEEKTEQLFQQKNTGNVTVAFYNCENLFDTHHQPGKQDNDFTPTGKYHYTQYIFEQKLHNIATVFQSMDGSDNNLAIAGLAEIENDKVLDDLCKQPELSNKHFRHICHEGPDPRGIDVGFIYDPSLFVLLKEEVVPLIFTGTGHSSHGRDILHVYGILDGDTVHVFVNHWTSRRQGEDESERKRVQAAQANKDVIDQLMEKDPNTRVIVMGDLNDNPTDRSIIEILAAKSDRDKTGRSELYNPFTDLYNRGEGTEKYRSKWNLFDQVMISGSLLQNTTHHLHYDEAEIYHPDFIVNHKKHSDEPKRSFVGSKWANGYSDHYPVLIKLEK